MSEEHNDQFIDNTIANLEYQKNELLSCILIMKDVLKIEFTEEEIEQIGSHFYDIKSESMFCNQMIYYTKKLMDNLIKLKNNSQNQNIQNHSEYHYTNEM
tara:strand:- start:46 stop:345 length:300 start_codon:yes stop_codon:yes gene_type:complete